MAKTQDYDEQFQNYLRQIGRKMGYLLANSTLSKEVQLELINLLPKMTLKQIDRLIKIFEAKFIDEQSREVDKKFQDKIKDLLDKFKKNRKEKQKDFSKIIDNYLNNLKI